MASCDPFADLEPLIRRVYAYVAYRIGNGLEAEDVTSETFERALRYRESYDRRKGEPLSWLLGIARHCTNDALAARRVEEELPDDVPTGGDVEEDTIRRLDLRSVLLALAPRDRELISLRYGADLKVRQIADLLGERTNTVEVALHRALGRLRHLLADEATPELRDAPRAPTSL